MERSGIEAIEGLARARDVASWREASEEGAEEVQWEIEYCPTSVFGCYELYRIERWEQWRSETWYLGWASGADAYWLEGDPVAFVTMAQSAGVCLEDGAAIWEYAQWYLLITQMQHWEDFLLIESVDQVCFLDEIDVDVTEWDEWRKRTFLKDYRSRIRQPHIHRVGQSATVDVFAIRNQTLEEHHLLIERRGALWHTLRVLETGLPLAVAGYGSRSLIRGHTSRES